MLLGKTKSGDGILDRTKFLAKVQKPKDQRKRLDIKEQKLFHVSDAQSVWGGREGREGCTLARSPKAVRAIVRNLSTEAIGEICSAFNLCQPRFLGSFRIWACLIFTLAQAREFKACAHHLLSQLREFFFLSSPTSRPLSGHITGQPRNSTFGVALHIVADNCLGL